MSLSEYEYLRGDPRGALQQIWGEIHSALDMDVFTTATSDGRLAHTLLQGLMGKAELGLASADRTADRLNELHRGELE